MTATLTSLIACFFAALKNIDYENAVHTIPLVPAQINQ
jgi:hypothetical protein